MAVRNTKKAVAQKKKGLEKTLPSSELKIKQLKKELEIESALEKVRREVLSMKRGHDLIRVCKILFEQFEKLGFENMRDTQIAIADDQKGSYMNFEWYGHDKSFIGEVPYSSHPFIARMAKKMRSHKDRFFMETLKGETLKDWKKFLQKLSKEPAPRLKATTALHYNLYSIGVGALGICSYSNLNKEEITLLNRFKNLFEFCYSRYQEIKIAEKQVKEAKIETAIEKIRARSLAMQSTAELREVVTLLFNQLKELQFRMEEGAAIIMIYDPASKEHVQWIADPGQSYAKAFKVPDSPHLIPTDINKARKKKMAYYSKTFPTAEKNKYFQHIFTHSDYRALPDYVKEYILGSKKYGISIALEKYSALAIPTNTGHLLTEEEAKILKRFSKVFDQAYARFLDLQKVEQQAREAQIQLALERVRARTMAMHKSEELSDTAYLMFQQFHELGEFPEQMTIGILNEKHKVMEVYLTRQEKQFNQSHQISLDEPHVIQKVYHAWKQKKKSFVTDLTGRQLREYDRARNLASQTDIVSKRTEKRRIITSAFFKQGLLGISAELPFPEETIQILERFAGVFELTYTRFLDLKKAEAQTREAQIQLALERVRARAMAMQNSSELAQLIDTVQKELTKLEFSLNNCILWIMEEMPAAAMWWTAPVDKTSLPKSYRVPFPNLPYFNAVLKAWKKRISKWTYKLEKKDKAATDLYIFTKTELKNFPQNVKKAFQSSDQVYISFSFYSFGGLHLSTREPLSEEQMDIIDRFSKTFNLTYTRFLDLKKAEAQTREAQIETALERVRSRTMGMQNSEDLLDVIKIISDQFQILGLKFDNVSFAVVSESHDYSFWTYVIGQPQPLRIYVPYLNHPMFERVKKARKKGEPFFTDTLTVEENRIWHEHMLKHSQLPFLKGDVKTFVMNSGYARSIAFMPNIMLIAGNYAAKAYTEAENRIISRFANVFEQSYTRFLDLKNAEAQAREAQIEASLERVRAKTIAMHNSSDVADTVQTMFNELVHLGIESNRFGIGIMHEPMRNETWIVKADTDGGTSMVIGHLDMSQHALTSGLFKSWREKKEIYSYELKGQDLVNYFKYLNDSPDYPLHFDLNTLPKQEFNNSFFFNEGAILVFSGEQLNPEAKQIFRRFAGVFGQTYRRYLDLQKAETQAREAEIQLALERVRARTMAMHNSEELGEAAKVLFEQFNLLGKMPDRMSIGIINETTRKAELWLTDQSGKELSNEYFFALDEPTSISKIYKGWKEGKKSIVVDLTGKDLDDWLRFILEDVKLPIDLTYVRGRRVQQAALFSKGFLLFTTHEPVSEEIMKLLERFAQAFDLTYTRFLDLQKAEAQARESKIQLALERVRARTMAMQKSEELPETAAVLFEQFRSLGQELMQMTIGIVREDQGITEFSVTDWSGSGKSVNQSFNLSNDEPTLISKMYKGWKQKKKSISVDLSGRELEDWLTYRNVKSGITVHSKDSAGRRVINSAFFSKGHLSFSSPTLPDTEKIHLLERFAAVFDLTYTRFLDLQKAEAQAYEAKVEASLERVRAQTMAMHNSQDVTVAVATLFTELEKLGCRILRCGVANVYPNHTMDVWSVTTMVEDKIVKSAGNFDTNAHPVWKKVFDLWEQKAGYLSVLLHGKEKEDYFRILRRTPNYLQADSSDFPDMYFNAQYFSEGVVWTFSPEDYTEEEKDLLKRFTAVFSLTYKRYQDLKKAEARAREAQIEAALEKVRSRSLAMHKSEELKEVITVVLERLQDVGIVMKERSALILVFEPGYRVFTQWVASWARPDAIGFKTPYIENEILKDFWESRESGIEFYEKAYPQEVKNSLFEYFLEKLGSTMPSKGRDFIFQNPHYSFAVANEKNSSIALASHSEQQLSPDEIEIIKRFARVFEQSYIRFLDLQKAEAQAREALIEAALERIRAKAQAMRSSEDLLDVVSVMREQMSLLGQPELESSIIHLYSEDGSTLEAWYEFHPTIDAPERAVKDKAILAIDSSEWSREVYQKYLSDEKEYTLVYGGKKLEDWYRILQDLAPRTIDYDPDGKLIVPEKLYYHFSKFSGGALLMISNSEPSRDSKDLQRRASTAFDLAYQRHKDLKKAEAQAREAAIEASLEKVRSKAMAMHNSQDLSETASMVFSELRKLGIESIRCGVGLLSKETTTAQIYATTSTSQGDNLALIGSIDNSRHPVLKELYESWLQNIEAYPELSGESLRQYYQLLSSSISIPSDRDEIERLYGNFIPFSSGCLFAWAPSPFGDAERNILKRFASIIDLTFRRYSELQKSEENAREAIKQAALDRIRADIASMRTVSDLDRITPLIWNELKILGLSFIRCGVFIIEESKELIHTFLSNAEGKAIAAFHLPFATSGKFLKVLEYWRKREKYIDHWDESDFSSIAETLVRQGAIQSPEDYLKEIPREGFHLHFLPFLQGMLYVGSMSELEKTDIDLIQSVSEAFSTAYARYEDFIRLETAKRQVEQTLGDLKQAQQQLVQSEKMASLGELTAGIAHEIQNPLNFVNNFSDINRELIEEVREEIKNGNLTAILSIANDLEQNLEKIAHHGKRADDIVKSMLQHSRSSSGQKEPTDINALCDEYLRLSYHGMRARDKSFNAQMETHFDPSIGKVPMVPQEIGRVLLNLFNNAFYAVSERKKQSDGSYNTVVTVSTGITNQMLEIKIQDNGNGIPETIKEKIFQPFFTTKPTGQGTGLGLSLSYDIIKLHGGEINFHTTEGEGTEFVIKVPVN